MVGWARAEIIALPGEKGQQGQQGRFDDDLREILRAHLAGFERRSLPAEGRRPAAVAVVVMPDAEGRASVAAVLHQFAEVAVRGLDTRVAHFEQPRFAWS